MKTHLIRIGNSRGIRIPKGMLDHLGFTDEVELEPVEGKLVIQRSRTVRAGWAEAFDKMAARGDDALLDTPARHAWDEREWRW